jgi:sec-independent protein translocase protein TatC
MSFWNTKNDPAEMPFLDHLEELRKRLLISIVAIVVGTVIGFYLVMRFNVLVWLMQPIKPYLDPNDPRLIGLSPADGFMVTIGLALTVGFLLAFPIVAAQVWAFVSPALHKKEKRFIVPSLYLGLVLFIAGASLAYFLALPMTFKFFSTFQTDAMKITPTVGPYFSIVVKILLAFGAIFEMPVVVIVLSSLGLITSKFLREKRRFAIAGSAVAAALLTPGDALSVTVFMMGPMIVLYELSIGLARLIERRKEKALLQDPLAEAS